MGSCILCRPPKGTEKQRAPSGRRRPFWPWLGHWWAHLVDGAFVVVVDGLLFYGLSKVPEDDGAVGGGGGQPLLVDRVPRRVLNGKVQVRVLARLDLVALREARLVDLAHPKNCERKTMSSHIFFSNFSFDS